MKNQVRAIARSFGAPESLVEKVPTADLEDLSPGKPDEASHGVTYAEIDAFLHGEPVREEAFKIICRHLQQDPSQARDAVCAVIALMNEKAR